MEMVCDMMKMKMKMKTKKTKMEITSSPELTYGFLLLFSLVIFSFPNLSSSQSQYNSAPRNIETFYPNWPPPPPQSPLSPSPSPYLYSPPPASLGPHPPPPQPSPSPSSSSSKAIITAVGVSAASALVVAALLFLLLSRRRKSTSNGKPPPPEPIITQSRVTRAGGNVIVDEEGLDHLYWKELKKSQNGVSNRSQIHPDPGARHRSTSVALRAVPDSGDNGSQSQPLEPVVADPPRGDIMEAMFGTVATNRKRSPGEENISRSVASESSDPDLTSKIFILDPQNSENIMALLRSIGMPCGKLIKALLEGKGMSPEGIVQLTSISTALTSDQVSEITAYKGDPARLADAEAFLYAVLKAVPTAFARAERMLFWCHYDADILKLKESLQTLELACDELRSRGIILKLLQAIHSTGTRLCIGSLSEEAKAFKLNTLRKLCEYKSSDGKTTLLHFVVHQVVRNEGRRCFMARNSSMSRQNTNSSMTPLVLDTTQDDDLAAAAAAAKVEKEKEFLMLGLPIVGGLSSDFSNVKKAANMDYDGLKESLDSLVSRVREARRNDKSIDGGGGFEMEMRYLLESAEVETKAGQVEHARVMSLVKKTAQYYQPEGASNHSNPLQLFVILKDFLSMIDQTCVDIARNLQQNQVVSSDLGSGSDSSQPDNALRSRVNFPGIPLNFFSDTPIGNVGDDS